MRVKQILLIGCSLIFLTGCFGGGKEKEARILIENFSILDDYTYDKVKVVVEEEKTPEELAREILVRDKQLDVDIPTEYDEYGVSPRNGLFINAAILDGPGIPVEPAFNKEAALRKQEERGNVDDVLLQNFEELRAQREEGLARQQEQEEINIAQDIQRSIYDQQDRIREQQEQRRMQDELFGVPNFEVVMVESES